MYKGVYSDYEVNEQHIKTNSDGSYTTMSCVGTSEEVLDTKVITKKCRGRKEREIVKGTGTGTLTETLHVPREIYNAMYDLTRNELKEGVKAYGRGNKHPESALTQKVLDEDDVVKYKSYPRAVLESGPSRPIDPSQEEVPPLTLVWALLPDDNGYCMYEALESDLDAKTKEAWMESWTSALMKKPTDKTEENTEEATSE